MILGSGERCLICQKRVYATERLPMDSVGGDSAVMHKTCLKCDDCSSTLKMDTYTRIGDKFYCKRHAADHQEKVVKGKAAEGESKVAAKFKVERDMCPVCDKAVYATEKLIVSDTFASKVARKRAGIESNG